MHQQTMNQTPQPRNKRTRPQKLEDYYGQELNVGDLVLGAVPGGRFYKTEYKHSLVIGRTDHMLLVHQIGMRASIPHIIDSLQWRGKQGGRVNPREVIRVAEAVIPEKTIADELSKAIRTKPVHPLPTISPAPTSPLFP